MSTESKSDTQKEAEGLSLASRIRNPDSDADDFTSDELDSLRRVFSKGRAMVPAIIVPILIVWAAFSLGITGFMFIVIVIGTGIATFYFARTIIESSFASFANLKAFFIVREEERLNKIRRNSRYLLASVWIIGIAVILAIMNPTIPDARLQLDDSVSIVKRTNMLFWSTFELSDGESAIGFWGKVTAD